MEYWISAINVIHGKRQKTQRGGDDYLEFLYQGVKGPMISRSPALRMLF